MYSTDVRAATGRAAHSFSAPKAGLASLIVVAVVALGATAARAADNPATDPHAHHHAMMQSPVTVARSTVGYAVPDVTLLRSDGARVKLAAELDDGRPVLLNFIYTTCTTICPLMTQTFAEVQNRLGRQAARVKMVSVSIDPEEDTPSRLSDYAKRFRAGAQWTFYTGTPGASVAVQRAFDVYRGDKMNHAAATLFRSSPAQPWVRLDGFATQDDLLSELRPLLAGK
jgi:protein SCO1/2